MSYSRPSIRPVSVRSPGRREETAIIDSGRVTVNPSGRLIDFSDANIAGKNAGRTDLEIKNFIDQATPLVKRIGTQIIQDRAQRQLGELLDQDPSIGERFRQSDPDAQAKISSLSGLAKDMFMRSQQGAALQTYQDLLPSMALADPRLTAATARNDPEAYAKAYSDVQAQAAERAGFSALLPGQRGMMSADVGRINGAVQARLYNAQDQAQRGVTLTTVGDGLVSDTVDLGRSLTAVQIDQGGNFSPEEPKRLLGNAQIAFEADIKEQAKGVATAPQHLANFLARSQVKIDQLKASGKWSEAENLLNTIEALSAGEIKLENGLNYWEQAVPVGKGKTTNVSAWITQQRNSVDALQTKIERQEGREAVLDLVKRAAGRDSNAYFDVLSRLEELDSPESVSAALQFFSQGEAFGDRLTPQDLGLVELVADPNRDKEAVAQQIRGLIRSGDLPMGRGLALLLDNMKGSDVDAASQQVLQAGRVASESGAIDTLATQLTRQQAASLAAAGRGDQYDLQDLQRANAAEIKTEAFNRTKKQVDDARAKGEPLTAVEVQKAFNENAEAVTQERLDKLIEGGLPQFENPAQIIKSDLNEMRQNILNGKQGVDMFPQRIIDMAQRKGIDLATPGAYNRLSKLLQSQMQLATTPEGTPEYEKPGQFLKNLVQDSKRERGKGVGNGNWQKGIDAQREAFENGTQLPPNEGAAKSKGDQSSNPISDGLAQIARVITPGGGSSAAAGELPASVVNEDQIEVLARMWAGRQPPSLQTPPVTQVAANAQTESVPLSINSDRHQYFVAIGIAEGTRTASGGYTQAYYGHRDPGDNNFNRGTVSGGRGNNLTPQQVDRRWMGILTTTGIKTSPSLQALGLSPGTQGWNRVMFNVLDLQVQAPAALRGFLMNLRRAGQQGWSVEAIAKARADAFYRYDGSLDAPGFNNNYSALFRDQRSRAGVWDYRRRL